MMSQLILAINPGSTSTKLGLFDGEQELWKLSVQHDPQVLARHQRIIDQYEDRLTFIQQSLEEKQVNLEQIDGFVGRGGIFDPIPGGTYRITQSLVDRLAQGIPWDHASNLGGRLAYGLAQPLGRPSFIVDPVSVDELDDVARISGLPQLPRVSLIHALNCKAMARQAAAKLNKPLDQCRFVIAHLGGGITLCAYRDGRIVDFDSGNDGGPMAPERAGRLAAADVLRLAEESQDAKALKRQLAGNSGLKAYCGTTDMIQIQQMAEQQPQIGLVLEAFVYGVACTMGMMATALDGKVDAFILTGGIAHGMELMKRISDKIDWIAPTMVLPGEDELRALAQGALRVLTGEEKAKEYVRQEGGYVIQTA